MKQSSPIPFQKLEADDSASVQQFPLHPLHSSQSQAQLSSMSASASNSPPGANGGAPQLIRLKGASYPDSAKGTSYMETMMHIVKANIGTGVLAMPLAFKHAGLVLSSLSLWLMAAICVHCMHILIACYRHVEQISQKQNEKMLDNVGYDDVVELVAREKWSSKSRMPMYCRNLVSVLLVFAQLGACCVYMVFVPSNLKQVVDFYYPENKMSVEIIMCFVLGPLILFCMIKDLKMLAPFSAFANLLMIVSMFVIMMELLRSPKKPLAQLDMVAAPANWPVYFSTAIYAFEGISLVLPVHNEMRVKEHFTPWMGVLNIAMTIVALIYFAIGFFGYIKYGNEAMASVTLNLPVDNTLFQAIKIMFAVAIFISYNLQFYVAAEILWPRLFRSSVYLQSLRNAMSVRKLCAIEHLFRSSLIVLTFLLAISIPRIDLFISLIGSFSGSLLATIIPPIMDMIVFWPTCAYPKLKLAKNAAIVAFGIYLFFAGTFVSLEHIWDYIQSPRSH